MSQRKLRLAPGFAGMILCSLLAPAGSFACQCPPPYRYTTDTLGEGKFRVDKFLLEARVDSREVTEAGLLEQLKMDFSGATVILHARVEQSHVVADSGKLVESLEAKYTLRPDTVRTKVLSSLKGANSGDSAGFNWGGHACDFGNFGNLKGLDLLLRDSAGTWKPSVIPTESCGIPTKEGSWLVGSRIYRSGFGEVSVSSSQFQAEVSSIARRKSGQVFVKFARRLLMGFDFLGRRNRPHREAADKE